jgi:hypothetical protein
VFKSEQEPIIMYNVSIYFKDVKVFKSSFNGSIKEQTLELSSVLTIMVLCDTDFILFSITH